MDNRPVESGDRRPPAARLLGEESHVEAQQAVSAHLQQHAGEQNGPGRRRFNVRVRQMVGFLIEHFRGDQKPDAIAATSDTEAFYICSALRLMGLEPGRDVVIAGYDNFWDRAPEHGWEKAIPAVTVDKLNHRIGEDNGSAIRMH